MSNKGILIVQGDDDGRSRTLARAIAAASRNVGIPLVIADAPTYHYPGARQMPMKPSANRQET